MRVTGNRPVSPDCKGVFLLNVAIGYKKSCTVASYKRSLARLKDKTCLLLAARASIFFDNY